MHAVRFRRPSLAAVIGTSRRDGLSPGAVIVARTPIRAAGRLPHPVGKTTASAASRERRADGKPHESIAASAPVAVAGVSYICAARAARACHFAMAAGCVADTFPRVRAMASGFMLGGVGCSKRRRKDESGCRACNHQDPGRYSHSWISVHWLSVCEIERCATPQFQTYRPFSRSSIICPGLTRQIASRSNRKKARSQTISNAVENKR